MIVQPLCKQEEMLFYEFNTRFSYVLLGDRTKWYTDKMVYGQNGMDKMAWTKWYNFIFCVHFNSVEFNIYLVTKSHK